jgi:hypothetical protein
MLVFSRNLLAMAGSVTLFGASLAPAPLAAAPEIALAPGSTPRLRLAAREVQRYVYLRTGEVLPIAFRDVPPAGEAIIIACRGQPLAAGGPRATDADFRALGAESYLLQTTTASGAAPERRQLWIVGGDDLGALYGAYRFAERLGVRFYLYRDVVPDERVPLRLPELKETGKPLFSVRGLLPFHDFAEGADWWNRDDYLATIGQMAKLRMNFIGLHTYPECSVGPEPTVWIGQKDEYDSQGRVSRSYPASYHTTGRSGQAWWAYAPMNTADFTGGAADLFERDDFGADVMREQPFARQTPEGSNVVFNRTAELLRSAFAEARQLGVKTCLGTETPLVLPTLVRERIQAAGRAPGDPTLARDIYTAMFDRIARACPPDYYWLWTPENWTWEGDKPGQFEATARDIRAALEALERLGKPFTLATCGWVLGPQHDRAALDQLLPLDSPMSCINQSVGYLPIERQFTNLSARPKWAIPWLENDGELTQPQLWAGRMRFDAADARRLGCTGLIGIHWRTNVLAPNVAALAAAAWDQSWIPASFDPAPIPPQTTSGAIGGAPMPAPAPQDRPADAFVYQSVRIGMEAYDLLVPNGTYALTLKFIEPGATGAGQRVFTVKLNGHPLVERLDLAAQAGAALSYDISSPEVRITAGNLRLDFEKVTGEPCIAAIVIAGTTDVGRAPYFRRINCGGPAAHGYESDLLPGTARSDQARSMPLDDFYRDFATTSFGADAGPSIGRIFARLDGRLPQTVEWIDGPGGIIRHGEPWEALAPQYAFVDELAALRPLIRDAADRARFDCWLGQFRAYRAIACIGCAAGALDRLMEKLAQEPDPVRRREQARATALPLRLDLARQWTGLMLLEIAATETTADLGVLANLEQHSRTNLQFLTRHDAALVADLGEALPAAAQPAKAYAGPARIIVPTVRSSAHANESLELKVILVGAEAPHDALLCWRPLGRGHFRCVPLDQVARRVYRATLPALTEAQPAVEYYVQASFGTDRPIRWPASDHGINETLVLFEAQ